MHRGSTSFWHHRIGATQQSNDGQYHDNAKVCTTDNWFQRNPGCFVIQLTNKWVEPARCMSHTITNSQCTYEQTFRFSSDIYSKHYYGLTGLRAWSRLVCKPDRTLIAFSRWQNSQNRIPGLWNYAGSRRNSSSWQVPMPWSCVLQSWGAACRTNRPQWDTERRNVLPTYSQLCLTTCYTAESMDTTRTA